MTSVSNAVAWVKARALPFLSGAALGVVGVKFGLLSILTKYLGL